MKGSLKPDENIQWGIIASFVTNSIIDIAVRHGIAIPQDVAYQLTLVAGALVAHVWDMLSGDNKEPEKKDEKQP